MDKKFVLDTNILVSCHRQIYPFDMAPEDIIVTEEKYEPNIRKSVKIPNVCKEFSVDYIGLLEFMRELGIRFD